jgi:hypothetical protein
MTLRHEKQHCQCGAQVADSEHARVAGFERQDCPGERASALRRPLSGCHEALAATATQCSKRRDFEKEDNPDEKVSASDLTQ